MKNKPLLFLFLSLLGFGVGCLLMKSYEFHLCSANEQLQIYDVSCHRLLGRIGDPLFYGMGALAVVFLVLLFVPKAFEVWKKFAIWFVPLATLLFAFYPEPGSGDLFAPYPEQIFQWVSCAYVVISLAIIAFVAFRSPANAPQPTRPS